MPVGDDRRLLALLFELGRRWLLLGRLIFASAEQVDLLSDDLLLVESCQH